MLEACYAKICDEIEKKMKVLVNDDNFMVSSY